MKEGQRWFILQDNQVAGPYLDGEVEARLSQMKNPLVWGRGMSEWMPPANWREAKKNIEAAAPAPQEPRWKIRLGKIESGPFEWDQFIQELKKHSDFDGILVNNDRQPDWQEVYLVPKVADELGISRRAHARVPIMGTLHCEMSQGAMDVKVISISEGGLGVSGAERLKIGENFRAALVSPNLFQTINCQCETVYLGAEGYAGLRFVNLPVEGKSAVIEYIKKFKDLQK